MTNLSPTIDRLGVLKATIATLEVEEKALKAVLIENGVGAYEGDLFRVTVSETERANLDMKAVREKLSDQFIRCHTTFTQIISVRVVARNGR